MLLFRIVIPRLVDSEHVGSDKVADTIYAEANNPESALLGGLRWYDTFMNCRDLASDREITAVMVPPTTIVPRGTPRIKRFNVYYRVHDPKKPKLAVFAYGRTNEEAVYYAEKFGRFNAPRSKVEGVCSVERAV